jgi:hypothetical protein
MIRVSPPKRTVQNATKIHPAAAAAAAATKKRQSFSQQQWKSMSPEERRRDSQRMVADISKQLIQIKKEHEFLLNPHGDFMLRWDVVIMCALVFTALVTPYEIALLPTKLNMLFFINRLVDIIFTVDIVVNFRLMFFEEKELKLVKNRKKIARNYLCSWFFIDLVSVLPGYIDCFTIDAEGGSEALEMTMVLRLIRLAKMGRIMKASRIFVRWLTMVNIKQSGMTLLKNTVLLVGATHWMACAWALLLQFQTTTSHNWVNAWIGSSDVCSNTYSNSTSELPFANYNWELCHSPSELYTVALYWSFVNLVSGFAMWPTTQMEYIICICVMAIGGYIWAYIIAHITAVAINVSYDLRTYQETMDQVNDFLTENKVTDLAFARKLRKYVMFKRNQNKDQQTKSLLTKLSPGLGGECAKFGATVINNSKVMWLRTIAEKHASTMLAVTLSFESQIFSPQEAVHKTHTLFLICQGVCARDGQIMVRSSSWGEDSLLLQNEQNCFVYPAWTVTYVHLWCLSKGAFSQAIEAANNPMVSQLVRKATVKLAVIRGLQVAADRMLTLMEIQEAEEHGDKERAAHMASALAGGTHRHNSPLGRSGFGRSGGTRRGSGVWGKARKKMAENTAVTTVSPTGSLPYSPHSMHLQSPFSPGWSEATPEQRATNALAAVQPLTDMTQQLQHYIDQKHEAMEKKIDSRMDRLESLILGITGAAAKTGAQQDNGGAPSQAVQGPPAGLFPSPSTRGK